MVLDIREQSILDVAKTKFAYRNTSDTGRDRNCRRRHPFLLRLTRVRFTCYGELPHARGEGLYYLEKKCDYCTISPFLYAPSDYAPMGD